MYQPDLNALQSERKIVLPQGGDYIIPDGNYRCDACEKAYFDYPRLREQFQHQFFQIAFTFYTAEQVKQLLSQEWNTEKVSPQSIEAMKSALVARTHLL